MQELRDCTLRTEQSMHKLLGGIDRLIAAQAVREATAAQLIREASAPPEPAAKSTDTGTQTQAGERQATGAPETGTSEFSGRQ